MEEINKKPEDEVIEDEVVEEEEEVIEEESPAEGDEPEEEEESEDDEISEEDDEEFQRQADELNGGSSKDEAVRKAKASLYHTAKTLTELGQDPAEVLGINKTAKVKKPAVVTEDAPDVQTAISKELDYREARKLAKSEPMFNLMKAYIDKGLSVDDAYLLVNKKRIARQSGEAALANTTFKAPSAPSKPSNIRQSVPRRPDAEEQALARRGVLWNQKTQTYRGKYTEEYYDQKTKSWQVRKLSKNTAR